LPAAPRVTSAPRARRTHERRRRGLLRVDVELFVREREALVRRGLLAPEATGERSAVRDALHKLSERLFAE